MFIVLGTDGWACCTEGEGHVGSRRWGKRVLVRCLDAFVLILGSICLRCAGYCVQTALYLDLENLFMVEQRLMPRRYTHRYMCSI